MKKVGKTTRPFRYDLSQIPYDYTVEARNSFEGLDLIECLMPEEQWAEVHNIAQKTVTKTIPEKKNARRKVVEEASQIAEKREAKGKGERERYTQLNAEFQTIATRDKKAFLSEQCKEMEETNGKD